MALIKCKECGHDVSDKASACPNCGCPIEHTTGQTVSCPEEEQSKEVANETCSDSDTPAKPETEVVVDNAVGEDGKDGKRLLHIPLITLSILGIIVIGSLCSNSSSTYASDASAHESVENAEAETATEDENVGTTWMYNKYIDALTGDVTSYHAGILSTNSVEYNQDGNTAKLVIYLSYMSLLNDGDFRTNLSIMFYGDSGLCHFSDFQGLGMLVCFDNAEVDETWKLLNMKGIALTTHLDNEKALDFVQKLKKAKNVKIQVNLEHVGKKTFEFNVAGLKWYFKS